jgi:hypothetical protein
MFIAQNEFCFLEPFFFKAKGFIQNWQLLIVLGYKKARRKKILPNQQRTEVLQIGVFF